jgi:hypothetical protein
MTISDGTHATGVTQLYGATIVMGLHLKHPDAVVQLLRHWGELYKVLYLSRQIPTIVVLVSEYCGESDGDIDKTFM